MTVYFTVLEIKCVGCVQTEIWLFYFLSDPAVFTDSFLRDIVSDADKLDAIGFAGIERCRDFSKSRKPNANDDEIECDVVEHMHEKLLKLVDNYIRTPTAKILGAPLQDEMNQYLKCKSQ